MCVCDFVHVCVSSMHVCIFVWVIDAHAVSVAELVERFV